jgi:hypothetical protein
MSFISRDSAIRGAMPMFGTWNIHDPPAFGSMLTRYGISCPICSARYSAKVESFPPEYKAAKRICTIMDKEIN